MYVCDRMSAPAITITPETPFQDALKLMREHRFRRLPVVNEAGRLVGIVSERDLLHAAPSPATSLSIWEMNYLLSKLRVEQLMATQVIVVCPDTPIEEAARLMVEHKIGGLPVVDDKRRVVGVITETDIFKAFVEMLGSGRPGLRLTLRVPGGKGTLAKLAQAIADLDGNIVSVGTFGVDLDGTASLLIKVVGVSQDQLVETLEALGDHVVAVQAV
ncbi:MAG TPA: CBS domain-containing protein [Caldilineaceae bacterium]|nr:CBS domain-containing protein [Caldilineaceae bacterium]